MTVVETLVIVTLVNLINYCIIFGVAMLILLILSFSPKGRKLVVAKHWFPLSSRIETIHTIDPATIGLIATGGVIAWFISPVIFNQLWKYVVSSSMVSELPITFQLGLCGLGILSMTVAIGLVPNPYKKRIVK